MQKLIESLHFIQYVCNEYSEEECEKCPLGTGNGCCRVTETTPNAWNINDEVQKALL